MRKNNPKIPQKIKKLYRQSKNLPCKAETGNNAETLCKLSRQFKTFPKNINFPGLQTILKLTKHYGNFPNTIERFLTFEKFPDNTETF